MAATTYTTLQQFLTAETTGPFVSLYVPLQPRPTADKAKLLVKNLVHHAKTVMASAWPDADWAPYEAALAPLAADPALIAEVSGTGLGVLTNGAAIYLRALEYPVSETAMATARPQILPMVLDAQRHLVFDLLALQGDQIALYHNAGEVLTRTTLPSDAPLTLETTLGSELRGGALNTVSLGQDHSSYHGHNEKSAEVQTDQRRYYQAVDTYLAAHYSKKTETPLVVFGLTQNIAVFRELSRNPYLVRDQQIERSPSDLNLTAIDDILTPLRQAHATRQQEALLQTVDEARGNGTYDEDLGAILDAIQAHALARLIIRQGARINGRLLPDNTIDTTSEVAKHNNLLNDLAELTIAQGGLVNVLEAARLTQPVVAVRRYAAATTA